MKKHYLITLLTLLVFSCTKTPLASTVTPPTPTTNQVKLLANTWKIDSTVQIDGTKIIPTGCKAFTKYKFTTDSIATLLDPVYCSGVTAFNSAYKLSASQNTIYANWRDNGTIKVDTSEILYLDSVRLIIQANTISQPMPIRYSKMYYSKI